MSSNRNYSRTTLSKSLNLIRKFIVCKEIQFILEFILGGFLFIVVDYSIKLIGKDYYKMRHCCILGIISKVMKIRIKLMRSIRDLFCDLP